MIRRTAAATDEVRFGRYEVVDPIWLGTVRTWAVRRRGEDQVVCLRSFQDGSDDRFERELLRLRRCTHPNVCHVFESGRGTSARFGDELFVVTEFFDGQPFVNHARRADPGFAASVGIQAGAGLHAIHELEPASLHGDLAATCLFVTTDGSVKILDAELSDARAHFVFTVSGRRPAPVHLSPERMRGDRTDRRSDVYSLAHGLWSALAGQLLFARGDDVMAAIQAVLHDPIPDLRALRPDVPRALVGVLERGLARDPDARFATALDFADALHGAV